MFDGKGMFWWPIADGKGKNRHYYNGVYLEGKMHGKGEFKNGVDNQILKGYFANNLYVHTYNGHKYFLNPFDTKI